MKRLALLCLFVPTLLHGQVKLSTLTRSTSVTGMNDSALTLVTDSATRTRAATIAQLRKSLSVFAFDSLLTAGNLNLTGARVTGTPTWLSAQGITLSTAVQPNIIQVGTLVSLRSTGLITPSSTVGIAGSTTNDTVQTLSIGEYRHHETAINTTIALSTGTYAVVDSVILSAGDWDCSGTALYRDTSATTTQLRANVDTVSANISANGLFRMSTLPIAFSAAVDTIALPTPLFRMSVNATQKVFLNLMAMFSTNKVYAAGGLRCRRVR